MEKEDNKSLKDKNIDDIVIDNNQDYPNQDCPNQDYPNQESISSSPINDEINDTDLNENTDLKAQNADPIEDGDLKAHRNYSMIENAKKRLKIIKIMLISIFIILINIFIVFGIICALNRFNTKVYKNTFVFGKDISNFNSDQLVQLLQEQSNIIKENFKINVYQGEKDVYDIKADDIDFSIDIQKTSSKIMEFGRKDNFIIDNIKILKALLFKKEITMEYTYSSEKLDNVLKNIDLTLDNRYVDDTYSVDEIKNLLLITKGKTGNAIDYDSAKKDILNILKNFNSANYNIKTTLKKPADINVEDVYNKVKKDPQNAYIDTNSVPTKFVNEKVGYNLDVNKLKEVLDSSENKVEGTSIEFPLTIINPTVKLADITYMLYIDKLAGYTTYFNSSQTARGKNLEIALKYLNGAIIMPGETFSYYEQVGEINASKGYLDAATFKGGAIVNEIGGGVCQTSSTLYNVALMANMEIVERHQHGLPVGYVPPSRDATIYGNVLDFKFKNTRNYPVKIVTSYSAAGNMNISIYGTKEKDEYEVLLSSKVLYYIPFTTKYIYDDTVESGLTSVITGGVNGYASESYITKKLNGNVISSAVLSKDVYKAVQSVVKVGTKTK